MPGRPVSLNGDKIPGIVWAVTGFVDPVTFTRTQTSSLEINLTEAESLRALITLIFQHPGSLLISRKCVTRGKIRIYTFKFIICLKFCISEEIIALLKRIYEIGLL